MEQEKTSKEIRTKSLLLNIPIDLHIKCSALKGKRFADGFPEPSYSEMCIELIKEALELPKYKKLA